MKKWRKSGANLHYYHFFFNSSLRVIYSFSPKVSEISDKTPTDLALGFGSGHRLQ